MDIGYQDQDVQFRTTVEYMCTGIFRLPLLVLQLSRQVRFPSFCTHQRLEKTLHATQESIDEHGADSQAAGRVTASRLHALSIARPHRCHATLQPALIISPRRRSCTPHAGDLHFVSFTPTSMSSESALRMHRRLGQWSSRWNSVVAVRQAAVVQWGGRLR